MTCKECNREFKTLAALTKHITCANRKGNHPNKEEYYIKHHSDIGNSNSTCPVCGKKTTFYGIDKGFAEYCSVRCMTQSDKTKQKRLNTNIEKYGVDHPAQTKAVQEKMKKTNLERFGAENAFQNKEVQTKQKETMIKKFGVDHNSKCRKVVEKRKEVWDNKTLEEIDSINAKRKSTTKERFGVECAAHSEEINKKKIETNLKKYGCEYGFQHEEIKKKIKATFDEKYNGHPMNSAEVREKINQSNLEKYGTEHPTQLPETQEKRKETCIQKWGVEHPMQSTEGKEIHTLAIQEIYGVDNISQSPEIQERRKETCIERFGSEYFTSSEQFKISMRQSMYNRLFNSERLKGLVVPDFNIDEYNGIQNYQTLYPFKCVKCDTIFNDHLMDGHIPRCPTCYPKLTGSSVAEKEVTNFCKQFFPDLIENDRTILHSKELDIYIPEINLAIEFNGIYWHSELNGCSKDYHLSKTEDCEEKGIKLIHIFEDEWIEKQNIVKSMLKAKMGKIERKFQARKCNIGVVDNGIAKDFLFDNHLQGPINGKHFGLYSDDELLCVLTMAKPRFNKNYDWEILRFCNKVDIIVAGGYSKILKHFREKNKGTVITYVDKRYGNIKQHENMGFEYVRSSSPGYYYVKDYQRYSRLQYQKHLLKDKLEIFDPTLTEWENMQLNGFDRIWDCGNLLLEIK